MLVGSSKVGVISAAARTRETPPHHHHRKRKRHRGMYYPDGAPELSSKYPNIVNFRGQKNEFAIRLLNRAPMRH